MTKPTRMLERPAKTHPCSLIRDINTVGYDLLKELYAKAMSQKSADGMANIVDADQTSLQEQFDLGPRCLHRPVYPDRVYACANCGTELFHSTSKYEHHTPWPAFNSTITPDCLSKRPESPTAIKVSCAKCGNGLGHEFLGDGPRAGQSRF